MLVCLNYLVLNHASPAFIDRAESSFKSQCFFNEFIPINQLSATGIDEEGLANWGIKTDIGDATNFPPAERGPNKIIFKFYSQDCAPLLAYSKLKDLGFEVNYISIYGKPHKFIIVDFVPSNYHWAQFNTIINCLVYINLLYFYFSFCFCFCFQLFCIMINIAKRILLH